MRLLILGTGDQAVVLTHCAVALGWTVAGYVGRRPGRIDPALHHAADAADVDALRAAAVRFGATACGLGFGDNLMRAQAGAAVKAAGLDLATLVHPSAFVDPSAVLGMGTFVGPRAVVNLLARVGEGALINTAAVIEHDCVVEDYACVYTSAALAGMVRVEALGMVGLGARVIQGRTVGASAVVGAGAAVVEDVPANAVVVGVPAKLTRMRTEGEPFL